MELRITSKNVEISEEVRQYLERKLGKLVHHLPNITESVVEISGEKTKEPQGRYVVQVTLNSRGTLLRGESRAPLLATAIDGVTDILDRQIERFKGKFYARGRRANSNLAAEPVSAPVEIPEADKRVVRVKRFAIKPMSVDEAAEQMEMLGHDFFLFLNVDSSQFNVIYRRQDGDYGLIEPEVG